MSKISVVVPVYNAEKYLDKCINSVLRQKYKDLELILINDGSSDNSLNICNKYKEKDSRVSVINQKNRGSIEARKVGIDICKSEYITFLDADDWLDLNTFEILNKELTRSKSDVVVFNMYKVIGKLGLIKRKNKSRYFTENRIYVDDEIRKELVGAYLFGHPFPGNLGGKIYKSKFLKESGKFLKNIKFLGDDLFYNMEIFLKVDKVSVLKDCLYYYRAGGNTNKYMPYLFEDMVNGYKIQKEVIENYFQDDKENNYNGSSIMLLNTFKTALGNIFFSNFKDDQIKNIILNYLKNQEILFALNNEGVKKYFDNEFLMAIKNENVDFLLNLGKQYYKKAKQRRAIVNLLNTI